MIARLAAILLYLTAAPVWGHRLDEYLQGTILSIGKNRIEAQTTLTPGVAVFPLLVPEMDTDGDGIISDTEQQAYANRVLRDMSLTVDNHRLAPRLSAVRFPPVDEMKEGRGQIQLDFIADVPVEASNRKLTLENRHERQIAAYQVNCLIARDPVIRIGAQKRNFSQSVYELEYEETDVRSGPFDVMSRFGRAGLASALALVLLVRFVYLWHRRAGLALLRVQVNRDHIR